MSAEVVPFPAARRIGQIRKTAAFIAGSKPLVGEAHLRMQLDKLTATLSRRGIPPDRIAVEVAAYEAALRAELWRAVLTPGGAA